MTLSVRYLEHEVGNLNELPDGRLSFTYVPTWTSRADAFPISLTLPLVDTPYEGGAGQAFFANLLPEGGARQAVCQRLGISPDNDLALLRAIGGDCAGALSIVDPDLREQEQDHRYELLDEARLRSLTTSDVVPLLVGGSAARLSLAGAQDKLPVALIDGRLHLPLDSAPSTHILKLPNPRFAHLPSNEAFVAGLAKQVDFDVAPSELFIGTDPPSLLVERYDRTPSEEHWPVVRLHQEDLCQALGLPPTRKYEQEGGPSLVRVTELVRGSVSRPLVDVRRLIEWQSFNVIVGNADGHAKNLSILYAEGEIRLAPFYDLVSTRMYEALDRRLAMGVGGRRDPDQLHRAQWEALAHDLNIQGRIVTALVRTVAERSLDVLPAWSTEFRERHGNSPVLETLPRLVERRARQVLRHLRDA